MNVAIYFCNHLDAFDYKKVIATCLANNKRSNYKQIFKVFLINDEQSQKPGKDGSSLVYTFDKHPPIDMFIVAGTDHRKIRLNPTLSNCLVQKTTQAQLVVGIFAGTNILAEAGCFADLRVTKKQQDINIQQGHRVESSGRDHARWLAHIRVVTSGRIPEVIDQSLALIDKLEHLRLVPITNRQTEFDW